MAEILEIWAEDKGGGLRARLQENDEQTSSYELQINDFTDRIKANSNWEFIGIYSDEGISGTELSHRKGMLQMIEDARAGKIDHILAKSIARFAVMW